MRAGEDNLLELRHHQQGAAVQVGPAPLACTTSSACAWQLHQTSAGPLILASLPGVHSESPRELWVGLTNGHQLAFTPLWFGVHTTVDSSDLGPAWWLEPTICEQTLHLRAVARLAVARGEAPPPDLVRHEGSYQLDDQSPPQWIFEAKPPPTNCEPIGFSYP